jgi:hypothetical protein
MDQDTAVWGMVTNISETLLPSFSGNLKLIMEAVCFCRISAA